MVGNMENFKFKKSLGQNFLCDNNILNKIINKTSILPDSLIIEIGPGSGALTKKLIETGNNVIAFEIDERLKKTLNELENHYCNLKVVFDDFLKINVNSYINLYKFNKLYVIANIPYYITTPIVTKIIDEIKPDTFTIMVQKEVGNRLMAEPNTRDYGSLSVYSQFNYNVNKICDVSKNSFVPKPKVDSVVLKFDKNNKNHEIIDNQLFFSFIKNAFKHKRKNLKNNLYMYNLKKIEDFLISKGKDLTYRGEQISIDEFVEMYKYLFNK